MRKKYAIIGNTKFLNNNLFYSFNYIVCNFELFFNKIKKNEHEYNKYKFRKDYLFGQKIYGHDTLLMSLVRGFKKLNVGYTYNKITKDTEYVIILWTDKKELKIIENFKKKYKIKCVCTVPTACKYDYDYQYIIPQEKVVDYALVASEWVKKLYESKTEEKYWDKIVSWPSGVEIKQEDENVHTHKSKCLCYFKRLSINQELLMILNKYNIEYTVVEYSKYTLEEYYRILKEVDFVIFYQDYIETQGLAITEAWAKNVPTLIKYSENEYGGITAPYMTDKTGLYFKGLTDLEKIIKKYAENPDDFLNKFSPYKYVEEEMSDEITVQNLIKLINKSGD